MHQLGKTAIVATYFKEKHGPTSSTNTASKLVLAGYIPVNKTKTINHKTKLFFQGYFFLLFFDGQSWRLRR